MNETVSANSYDAIILGTSPVLLIEGLLRTRCGERIAFVENDPRNGGAWVSTGLDEVRDIESACLLLENYRGAYDYLQNTLGFGLELTQPRPTLLAGNGGVIAYNSRVRTIGRMMEAIVRMPVVAGVRIIEALTLGRLRFRQTDRFRFAAAFRKIGILLRHPMRGDREVRYFAGGAPRMLAGLEQELRDRGATFVRGRGRDLEVGMDDRVRLELEDGRHLMGTQFVGGESTSLASVTASGRTLEFATHELVLEHLIVEVRGLPADACSYVQMPSDPFVSRFNDVTEFCSGLDERRDSRILVVQLVQRTDDDPAAVAQAALRHLVDLGLLPTTVELLRCRATEIRCQKATPSVAAALRSLRHERLVVLPTLGDLSLTVLQCEARWREYLGRAGADRAPVIIPAEPAEPAEPAAEASRRGRAIVDAETSPSNSH
jgi:hypothetical protein